MSRLHSTFIALVLAAATAAGLFAIVHTVRLGQAAAASQAPRVAARDIALRRAKLVRWSRSLERARAKRPPALPQLPKFAPVHVPAAAPPPVYAAAAPAAPPAVTYVRPPAVVRYRHAKAKPAPSTQSQPWSDDGGGDGGQGGGDDGGGD